MNELTGSAKRTLINEVHRPKTDFFQNELEDSYFHYDVAAGEDSSEEARAVVSEIGTEKGVTTRLDSRYPKGGGVDSLGTVEVEVSVNGKKPLSKDTREWLVSVSGELINRLRREVFQDAPAEEEA